MNRPDLFFDVTRLLALRQVVRDVDPNVTPRARFLVDPVDRGVSRLALLPGSFNPPTTAHVALAQAVLSAGQVDRVDFLLASRTVDKERIEGATLADRLLILEVLASTNPGFGVVVVNRGLYVDQAEIVRLALPRLRDLWFVVGFDKILQIFDPRYYQDRDAALDRLFSLASIFVAPRGASDVDDLIALLNHPENRRYATRVTSLDLPASYRHISSTRLRAQDPSASSEVPLVVNQFMRETGAYDRLADESPAGIVDRYRSREKVLDLAERGDIAIPTADAFRAAIHDLEATSGLTAAPTAASTSPTPNEIDRERRDKHS